MNSVLLSLLFNFGPSCELLGSKMMLLFPNAREIYSYDSFQGFPNPTFHDTSSRNSKRGEWNHRTKQEATMQMMDFGFKSPIQFHFIEGFVEETLKSQLPNDKICFLHIDLDLYSGYKITLEKLWPLVAFGGIVLFDEYDDPKWPGATAAINEFIEVNSLQILRHPFGKYYIKKDKQI